MAEALKIALSWSGISRELRFEKRRGCVESPRGWEKSAEGERLSRRNVALATEDSSANQIRPAGHSAKILPLNAHLVAPTTEDHREAPINTAVSNGTSLAEASTYRD